MKIENIVGDQGYLTYSSESEKYGGYLYTSNSISQILETNYQTKILSRTISLALILAKYAHDKHSEKTL